MASSTRRSSRTARCSTIVSPVSRKMWTCFHATRRPLAGRACRQGNPLLAQVVEGGVGQRRRHLLVQLGLHLGRRFAPLALAGGLLGREIEGLGEVPAGHQTWIEEAGVSDLLRSERMGHEVPGVRGVYGHVSPAMRSDLKAMLQERWETSLRERARLSALSIVPALDALLAVQRELP